MEELVKAMGKTLAEVDWSKSGVFEGPASVMPRDFVMPPAKLTNIPVPKKELDHGYVARVIASVS